MDILPSPQRQLWQALAMVKDGAFVLYGGTAVALHFGHRESVDFDFFSHMPFRPEDLYTSLRFLRGSEILQAQPNTLTVLVCSAGSTEAVKVSFFGGLSFGRLGDPLQTADGVLEVASLQDLLAHKLKVLLQRIEAKDYQDVDALLEGGVDLGDGLGGARALFAAFAPQECLKALTYFEDEALRDLSQQIKHRLVDAVKRVRSVPERTIKAQALSNLSRT